MFSSDPFHRLTAGRTWSRTFKIFARRWDLFLIISGFVFAIALPFKIALLHRVDNFSQNFMHAMYAMSSQHSSTAITSSMSSNQGAGGTDGASSVAIHMRTLSWQYVLEYVFYILFTLSGKAAMVYAVAELYAGRNPAWVDCCIKAWTKWCTIFRTFMVVKVFLVCGQIFVSTLISACIMTQNRILVFLSLVILLAWLVSLTIICVTVWGLCTPVIMVEEATGPLQAIKRSWELSVNNRCYIFCTWFCLYLALLVARLLLNFFLAPNRGEDLELSALATFIFLLPSWIYLPLEVIAETVMYIKIRVEQEGLNKVVLEGELYGGAVSTTTSSVTKSNYAPVDRGVADPDCEIV